MVVWYGNIYQGKKKLLKNHKSVTHHLTKCKPICHSLASSKNNLMLNIFRLDINFNMSCMSHTAKKYISLSKYMYEKKLSNDKSFSSSYM